MSRGYDISDLRCLSQEVWAIPDVTSESRKEEPSRDCQPALSTGSRQESRNPHRRAVDTTDRRTIYRSRNREYSLRASEVQTLTDLGKFRHGFPADDLAPVSLTAATVRRWRATSRNLKPARGSSNSRSIEGPLVPTRPKF